MSPKEYLAEYSQIKLRNAELRCEILQNEAQLDILETRLKLNLTKPKGKRSGRHERFIEENDLTEQQIEFVSVPARPTNEVGDFLGIHRNSVSKALREGELKTGLNDRKGKRMVDTISVVESQLAGEY